MTEPNRAVPELVALLAKMRPGDWPDEHVLQGIVMNAATVGLTWPQVCVGLVRLAVDPDAQPGELIPRRDDPTKRRPGADPHDIPEWREARQRMRGPK